MAFRWAFFQLVVVTVGHLRETRTIPTARAASVTADLQIGASQRYSRSLVESAKNQSNGSNVPNENLTDAFSDYDPNSPKGKGKIKAEGAGSGWGSAPSKLNAWMRFLEGFLKEKNVTSMVEASCGHWPSGWQSTMSWPPLRYVGVDLTPNVIEADKALLKSNGADHFGMRSMEFRLLDMTRDELPPADVLLTKDTLQHFKISGVQDFLQKQISIKVPKYKYVLYVNDKPTSTTSNPELAKWGDVAPRDLSAAPFFLPVHDAFEYNMTDMQGRIRTKLVQVQDFTTH